ncbi:hypothetical protein [Carboxylicivirga sp. RSCT41]|uniref:hypothetical protein n=1 Tax=Carboxylicivirga agarovorans TaxID=3417570 RepID=UPI003D3324E2
MKTLRLGRLFIALMFLLVSAGLQVHAEETSNKNDGTTSTTQTQNDETQNDEEDPVLDPTGDPFSMIGILSTLGL